MRQELRQGRWSGVMPGRDRLARELGVHGSTVVRALGLLEQEGLLESAGAGRRRKIVAEKIEPRGTRVVIILYEPEDALSDKIMTMQQHLHAAGHRPVFSAKAMSELRHDPKRIMAMMEGHPADAWICVAGVRPVLEQLSKAATPTFALFGYFGGLPENGVSGK